MTNSAASARLPNDTAGRQVISLDGIWDFAFANGHLNLTDARLKVPGVWQAHFADLRNSHGTGTYRRQVAVPPLSVSQRAVLVFDGVFHRATVRVDGGEVATHANAWTPFEVDITDRLAGRSSFDLAVDATVPDDTAYAERGLSTMLHGKQDWYGLQGGIWKNVRLEVRATTHFSVLQITTTTDLKRGTVRVSGSLSASASAVLDIAVSRNGTSVAAQRTPISGSTFEATVTIDDVALWSPDDPNLYSVTAGLVVDGLTVDDGQRTVGFRTFEARDTRLYLNGSPFYMIGALDQDWYPEEECRAPDKSFLEQRFKNAKAMGLNTLRCHVKIPEPDYFDICDRLGLIVWLDMPYMEFLSHASRDELVTTFEAAVTHHGHHTSICVWTIANEGWGIDLDDNPDDRAWLTATFDRLKAHVPHSLLVDNSPCFPRNYHMKSEIEDFHWYNSWPSQNDQFQATTDAFAARAPWSFSSHGDAVRTGKEPLIVSEFGVWGLPYPHHVYDKSGAEPWWFESGHDWNNGAGYPHGIETRFRDAGLARIFGSLDAFIAAAQETQYRGLKHQIETLRYAAPISGYVITELNDTQWEANGLMDARNNMRAFSSSLAALQTPWLVVARAHHTALRSGETVPVSVRLTGAAPAPLGAVLDWQFGQATGQVALEPDQSGSAEVVVPLAAGQTEATTIVPLMLTVRDPSGITLSSNVFEFCIVGPLEQAPHLEPMDQAAAQLLEHIGWPAADGSREATLLATALDTPVREALLDGRSVLLIANHATALVDPARALPDRDLVNFPKMELRQREGTFWDGRWMGAFGWRRVDGPWSGLPNGPMLDEHWEGLHPQYVLTGFRSTAFSGLVDAGVAVAWIHKAAAFSKRSLLGSGWLTVTTFDLLSKNGRSNPIAPHLLAALARS